MGELDSHFDIVFVCEVDDRCKCVCVFIAAQIGAGDGDATLRGDGGGFDHDQAG